jgi:hypothetical protein
VTAEQLSSGSGAVALGELRLCGSEQSGRKSLYHAATDLARQIQANGWPCRQLVEVPTWRSNPFAVETEAALLMEDEEPEAQRRRGMGERSSNPFLGRWKHVMENGNEFQCLCWRGFFLT